MDFIESEMPKRRTYGTDGKKSIKISMFLFKNNPEEMCIGKKCVKNIMFKNYLQKKYIGIVVFFPQKYTLGKMHTKLCVLNK